MHRDPELDASRFGDAIERPMRAVIAGNRLPEIVRPVWIIGFIPECPFPGGVGEISIHQSRRDLFADDRFDGRAADVDFLAVMVGDERHRIPRTLGIDHSTSNSDAVFLAKNVDDELR